MDEASRKLSGWIAPSPRAGELEGFLVGRAGPVRDDRPVTDGDHPCACRVALGSADTPSHPAATRNHDESADVPVLLPLGLENIPELPRLGEVCAHAVMAAVSAALDASACQRQELHIGVVESQERVDIPGSHCLNASPDEFGALRHRIRS
jgi:hypothetical protein